MFGEVVKLVCLMQQRGVPCRPMPGLRRGGGHTTACAASVPGEETPAAPGHNKPGGDRGQRRRRGGGLGRRLPRPTEPTRLRPMTGPGGTTTTTAGLPLPDCHCLQRLMRTLFFGTRHSVTLPRH